LVKWYADVHHVVIAPENVYFFDDHDHNTNGWANHGFNARQISCASRDQSIENGIVGWCGAQMDEIVLERGIHDCAEGARQFAPASR